MTDTAAAPPPPSFIEALRFWFKLGFISFGGPAGQIAIMHQELVERRRWISEQRFLHALNYCMLLPGPEACQLAIYTGWLLHGLRGGLMAGLLFFLPAFASFCGFFFTARMVHRLGGLRMMRMGAGLSFLGAALLLGLTLAGATHPLALFLPGMLVCGANALSAPNSTTGAITAAPAIAGAASGLLGFFQLVVGAVATQLVAYLADGTGLPLAGAIVILNLAALALLAHITHRRQLLTVTKAPPRGRQQR
jgi:chromate transporter